MHTFTSQTFINQPQVTDERCIGIYNIAKAYIHAHNRDLLKQFISIYFQHWHTDSTDITSTHSDIDLAGMVLHHFMLFKSFSKGNVSQNSSYKDNFSKAIPQKSAFNPIAEEHHFYYKNSLIQLVVHNKPFLIDTILMTLDEHNIKVHHMHYLIAHVEHDQSGAITSVSDSKTSDGSGTSIIHIEVEQLSDAVLANVERLLADNIHTVNCILDDTQGIRSKLVSVQQEIASKPFTNAHMQKEEVHAFLDWILDGNFTVLGFKEYRFEHSKKGELSLLSVGGSNLGFLREDFAKQTSCVPHELTSTSVNRSTDIATHTTTGNTVCDKPSESYNQLPSELRQLLLQPNIILVSKSSHISPVQRPVYMDFLGINKLDDAGKVIGEYRFIGLFTAKAYQNSVECIPLLRQKSQQILDMSRRPVGGHAYNTLKYILNTLPRDELLQADTQELFETVTGIAQLQDKTALKLFARVDHYQRFVSCFVYVPNDKFNTELRIKIQNHLQKAFAGTSSEFRTSFDDASHARVHVHVRTVPGKVAYQNINVLEQELTNLMHDWLDDFAQALRSDIGVQTANHIYNKYGKAIPASYREQFDVRTAVQDIKRLHSLHADEPMLWHLYSRVGDNDKQLQLKIYGQQKVANLSSVLPVLEDFGVTVVNTQTYEFKEDENSIANNTAHAQEGIGQWIQEYKLISRHKQPLDLKKVRAQFAGSLKHIWNDKVESDPLNELILTTSLSSIDVVVLRALCKYMLQAKAPFSLDYVQKALVTNKYITTKLVELFHTRMQPDFAKYTTANLCREQATAELMAHINSQLETVKSLDDDRIIRWLLDIINALLRTNLYQDKDYQSFKFDAQKIEHLPEPKPQFEIYVYSPLVEGVHLRGGSVARGGLRWSDRKEDFRTEVLGLVKAQMVKNSVIVPVGSKGGFIVKKPRHDMSRDQWLQEGISCYKTFISGMLDITDNIINGEIIPPKDVVRHDGDDPYLVVAADKGTATFSDIANGLARDYGFWLDDAFASGGSVGYDHKAMGITAKGAWESVKRHFRLEGKDIQQKDDFSVVGIGDMSGDVFGNGMLLSKHIKLVCAFNHLDIFIDPNPDTGISYAERQRMFELPRSTWADYNKELISKGGGVFSRSDKFIEITDEMKRVFAISDDKLTPNELIHAVLKSPVDLIWNGGIGTYIKAESETHAQVGDKANDVLRVNGNQIQAKVIGEGGNLGATQQGRIEYAQNGGRMYTDAIDNSAGVNCSDHEVNIKILLGDVLSKGDITVKQRNELLESMTDTVSKLVLRQNYLQPQTIELSGYERVARLIEHQQVMQMLERENRLNRDIELLPSDDEIKKRQKLQQGLTNPEISVILAYVKMWVFDTVLASDLPNQTYYKNELKNYFPEKLTKHYFEQMLNHRLNREIISTFITNEIVNRLGFENLCNLIRNSGAKTTKKAEDMLIQLVQAYTLTREVFAIQNYWQAIEDLDNKVCAQVQIQLELSLREAMQQTIAEFYKQISNQGDGANSQDVAALIQAYKKQLANVSLAVDAKLQKEYQKLGLNTEHAVMFAQVASFVKVLQAP